MQKNSILHYFKFQSENEILCPACGISLPKYKLNSHLDASCSSSKCLVEKPEKLFSGIGSSNGDTKSNFKSSKGVKSDTKNMKKQRSKMRSLSKRPVKMEVFDDEIIILNEIQHIPTKDIANVDQSNGIRVKHESRKHSSMTQNCTVNFDKFSKDNLSNNCELLNVSILTDPNCLPNEKSNFRNNEFQSLPAEKIETNYDKTCMNKNFKKYHNQHSKTVIDSSIIENTVQNKRKRSDNNGLLFIEDSNSLNNEVDSFNKIFEDDSIFSELSDHNEKDKEELVSYAPYYITNFKHILETVLSNDENKILFNNEDISYIDNFKASSDSAQKLYVRLFLRKYKWLKLGKIKYPEITIDPCNVLEKLVAAKLVESGNDEIDLKTALDMLSLPESRSLAKHYKFTTSVKNKSEIIKELLKHCKEHKSVFFTSDSNSIANTMLKKVKKMIGPCYRLSLLPKRVFTRILMLFSLPTMPEDDEDAAGGQQQQLLMLLQVNKGELKFPAHNCTKESVIFACRDDLIRYEEARQLENDISNLMESKQFDLTKEHIESAKKQLQQGCSCDFYKRACSLPVFLRRYTSFHVYIRCMTLGVEALQKLRQYDKAVLLLKELLKQTDFCLDYHGRWYDRLALNLEQHLKKPLKALDSIKDALKDENVRIGYRHSLLTRALRITKFFSDEDTFKVELLREADVIEAPKVSIKGYLCPQTILGRRNVFVSSVSSCEVDEDVTVLSVEQVALEYYRENGFPEGIHGEGSTFHTLYGLLFWDIIYDDSIPDAFISPFQSHPLDLNSSDFFTRRGKQISSHLETLRNSSEQELREIVQATWNMHHGEASLITWDGFIDANHVQGLISCIGSHILCGICERLARDFRFTRSGVPDLIVWNPETSCVKIVEVKGPGDKLSSKQILWLDYLLKLGADAEVCLVEGVASKKLRRY